MVYVVEGYLDVMALDALQQAAVAPLGTALRNAHAKVLSRYTTDVRLVMDADDAGIAATKRAISVLEEIELQASVVALQEGLDPADYIERKAGNRLQATLSSPILSYEYLLRLAVSKRDLRRADGKEQAFRELLPYLTNVRSELKREALLRDLADVLEVSHDSVLRDFRRRTNRRSVPRRDVGSREHEDSVSRSAEMAFMLAAAANRDKFDRVQRRLTSNDLQDSLARELFLALQECTDQGDTSPDGLLSKLEHEELRLMVIRNLSEREFTVNPNEVLDDGARRLKVGALERRRRTIESLMRQEEGTDERSSDYSVRDLLEEKMFLDSELEKLKRVRVDVGPID
jgi:DNA primase